MLRREMISLWKNVSLYHNMLDMDLFADKEKWEF